MSTIDGHSQHLVQLHAELQLKQFCREIFLLYIDYASTDLDDLHQKRLDNLLLVPNPLFFKAKLDYFPGGLTLMTDRGMQIKYYHGDYVDTSRIEKVWKRIISEPIVDWGIVYGFNIGNRRKEDRFKTLQELKTYFHRYKRRGELVGYVIVIDRRLESNDERTTWGRLAFWYKDQHTIYNPWTYFKNVHKMIEFFKEYPQLGKCVGYEPK